MSAIDGVPSEILELPEQMVEKTSSMLVHLTLRIDELQAENNRLRAIIESKGILFPPRRCGV